MATKIRLARGGSKKKPFYRIVAADVRSPRDGRFLEKLGTYNPLLSHENEQRLVINDERIKHWLSVGAEATERVQKLLSAKGLLKAPKINEQPKKSALKKKAQERLAEKQAAAAEAESEA